MMEIDFVRSRFIKHFDGMHHQAVSTSLASIPTIMVVSYSLVPLIRVSWRRFVPTVQKIP